MALTQPYLDQLYSEDFDVTRLNALDVKVVTLNSDVANNLLFTITNLSTTPNIVQTVLKQNVTSSTIGNFTTYLEDFDTGMYFSNGNRYSISVQTCISQDGQPTIYSLASIPIYFSTFATPTISLTSNGDVVTSDTTLTSFINNFVATISGDTTFKTAQLTINGNKLNNEIEQVYQSPIQYGDMFNASVDLLETVSANRKYLSYTIIVTWDTIGGMVVTNTYTPILVQYDLFTPTTQLTATNLYNDGCVKLDVSIDNTTIPSGYYFSLKIYRTQVYGINDELNGQQIELMRINYNRTTLVGDIFSFTMFDTFNQHGCLYEYQLYVPNQVGNPSIYTTQVYSEFNQAYICDASNLYNISNSLSLSNIEQVQLSSSYQTLGSKYPIVSNNSMINYVQGSLSSIVLSSSTQLIRNNIDRQQEVKNRIALNKFLTNKRTKIIKDFNGNLWVAYVIGSIANNFANELGNGISSTSYSWNEIGELTQESLFNLGMLNIFPITYGDGSTNNYQSNININGQ